MSPPSTETPRRLSVQQRGPRSINQLGGVYTNGCPLPPCKRQSIIQLAAHGVRSTDISRSLQVSNGCVSKILSRYYRTGSIRPKRLGGSKPRAVSPPAVARIAQLRSEQPSLFAWEIRRQLHLEGLCGNQSTPSVSSINRVLRGLQGTLCPAVLPGGENVAPSSATRAARPPGTPPDRSRQRSRTTLSQQQSKTLEEEFQRGQYPDSGTRGRLAAATQLPDVTIQVWFSNRRAKWRREARQRMEANGAGCSCEWLLSPPATTAPISVQHLPAAPPSLLKPLGAPPAPLHVCTPRPCSWDAGCCGSGPLPTPWQPLEGPPLALLPSCPPLHPSAHLHAPPLPLTLSMLGNGGVEAWGPRIVQQGRTDADGFKLI